MEIYRWKIKIKEWRGPLFFQTKTTKNLKKEKDFNINSPIQFSRVLFEKLNVPKKGLKKTPGGVVSTAAPELEKLQGCHPVIEHLLKYRELQKLYSTYIKPIPQLADKADRIHTSFDQFGASTGRISSSSPNLQNIPVKGDWGRRIRS